MGHEKKIEILLTLIFFIFDPMFCQDCFGKFGFYDRLVVEAIRMYDVMVGHERCANNPGKTWGQNLNEKKIKVSKIFYFFFRVTHF